MGHLQETTKSLAKQLAVNLKTDQKILRVGIVPLSPKNGGSLSIAEPLQSSLKNNLFLTKRFDVVEDDDMQKVLSEMRIQEQGEGILRSDTIHHMGELLGADAILVGKISYQFESTFFMGYNIVYLIDYRLVPIKNGVVGSVAEEQMVIPGDSVEIPVNSDNP